jgi:hypothetical protein
MSWKLLVFILAIVVVAGLILWSGSESDRTRTVETSLQEKDGVLPHGHPAVSLPLPTISRAHLAVQDAGGTDLGKVSLVPNEPTPLENTRYQLKLTEFYTHWNWDKRPVNLSYNERNPAARIEVLESDSIMYYQWAFRDMKFFRKGGMGGHPGAESDQLAFALLGYEGLALPERPAAKE